MYFKKSFYLLILFSLASSTVSCQKIFREGYIIKNDGEILYGLVRYAANQDIPSVCVFKRFEIAFEITYKSSEIKEFGYVGGNRYVSLIIGDKEGFYEIMASGKITLYRNRTSFFLEKGKSGIVNLNDDPIKYSDDGGKQTFDELISFLKYITEGKTGNLNEKLKPKKDLLPLIAEYNKQSGERYIVYNQEFSENMLLNESFRSGAGRNRYGVLAGLNIYSLKIETLSSEYLPVPQPEFSVKCGFTYERVISHKTDRLAFRADLMFLKQNFYTYNEWKELISKTVRDDAFFDFTGINLPLMLQYSFTSGRIIPYLNAGLSCTTFIRKNYLHIRETESSSSIIVTNEDSNLHIGPGEIGGLVGVGLKLRLINSIHLNLQGRIVIGNGLFDNSSEPIIDKQHSIQPTFLVGINF